MTDSDPFRLSRFVEAQARNHGEALAELASGRKRSHWMWYVFPQLRGLGLSPTAQFYGIASLDEARAFLAHPVLGPRLLACTGAVLRHRDRSLRAIFGSPDDMKFRSSMTLFAEAARPDPRAPHAEDGNDGAPARPFRDALDAFCDGEADPRTLALLDSAR